jgi:hypothetical protein
LVFENGPDQNGTAKSGRRNLRKILKSATESNSISESANKLPRHFLLRLIRAIHDASFLLAEPLATHSRQLDVNTLAEFGKCDGKKIGERATVTGLPESQPAYPIEYPSAGNSNKHFRVTPLFQEQFQRPYSHRSSCPLAAALVPILA